MYGILYLLRKKKVIIIIILFSNILVLLSLIWKIKLWKFKKNYKFKIILNR